MGVYITRTCFRDEVTQNFYEVTQNLSSSKLQLLDPGHFGPDFRDVAPCRNTRNGSGSSLVNLV